MKRKILLFLVLFLLFPVLNIEAHSLKNIIISEVMHGIREDGKNYASCEFIEIYNLTSQEIDLKELIGDKIQIITKSSTTSRYLTWKTNVIEKNSYFLIVSKECSKSKYYSQLISLADATYSAFLSEEGGVRIIKNDGEILDEILLKENKIEFNQSLERNLETGEFFIQNCPNPTNSKNETFYFCSTSTTPTIPSQPTPIFSQISPSDIVINEFVPDPVDGEEEWIELYNNTDKEIDLTGFYIEEGSGAQTFLNGKILPKGFFVVEKIKGYLNNSGDIIFLKDPTEKIIDKVTYGNWNDGNLEDNAPTAKDPYSIARIIDGRDSDEDNLDFKIANPTKGTFNQILNLGNFISGIVINEILPNPKGDDSEKEFIELKNLNNFEVDLEGWYLQDSSNRKFIISSKKIPTKIPKNGFLVIFRKDSKIALNNSGEDCVKLFQPDKTLVDSVCYSEEALEEVAFARNEKGEFEWTEILTPGKENEIKKPNKKPKAKIFVEKNKILVGEEIFFDRSDSFDPDGDNLKFLWDFGDGNKKEGAYVFHTFSEPKKYKVTLKVEDERGAFDVAEVKIEVSKNKDEEKYYFDDLSGKLFISEIFPNPKGRDDQEFIEIFNFSDETLDISNFILTDKSQREYKIKEGTKIEPKSFLVFWKNETKISLNNDGDEVRLLDSNKKLIDKVFYSKAPEGLSLSRTENGEMIWTEIVTPGKENEFLKESKEKIENLIIKNVGLKEIKNLNLKEKVKTKGVVSVEPGVFAENILYLSGSGIKVKFNFQEIPKIRVGDELEILGEIFEEEGEKGIEVFSKENVKILGHKIPPKPKEIKIEEINEEFLSSLIKIKGEITEIKENFIWLKENEKEILIFLKEKFKENKNFEKGDSIKVAGILRKIGNQFILFTRNLDDLELIQKPKLKSSLNESIFQKNSKLILAGILMLLIGVIFVFLFKKKKFFLKA